MKITTLLCALGMVFSSLAQQTSISSITAQVYANHPTIPSGLLEAVSFVQTRMQHLDKNTLESCEGLPKAWGYLGLIGDGKKYFRSNLSRVSELSGISTFQLKTNPVKELTAYAMAYESLKSALPAGTSPEVELKSVLTELSFIPTTGKVNEFALASELYEIVKHMNDGAFAAQHGFLAHQYNLVTIFGAGNLAVLSSPRINFAPTGIQNAVGHTFVSAKTQVKSTEFGPAVWNPAPTCNYSSRNGTAISAITIHTIQGTYAGAISWSQNCSSSVSYHYVVRSSDGQVTQMVLEANKAWHVGSENPYTIGYEHEGYVNQTGWYTTAMYNASAAITRDICQSGYGINPLRTFSGAATSGTNTLGSCIRIKGHQHFPNQTHTDPGINWDWALYYRLVNNAPTQTVLTAATGIFTDTGGASGAYANDERYFTLIQPTNASSVNLSFTSFNVEANWDYMYIYDGATTSAPLLGTYTGTASPGTVVSSGGSLLIEFRSDCASTGSGWEATWSSTVPVTPPTDGIAPSTAIVAPTTWVTQNFNASFTDADNQGGSGIDQSYYQVIDFDGSDWRASGNDGFFSDNFDQTAIHPDWTLNSGTWGLTNGTMVQTDEANSNTNAYATVNHSLSNLYLYNWSGALSGTGTSRRAGLHYFCSDPTLPNRGNSYFVYFRLDNAKVQIYKVTNDVFTLENEVSYTFTAGTWYDFKVVYDRTTGKHQVYIDNALVQTWTDSTPINTGNYISFRSGNCTYAVNNLKVYRSRASSVNVTVGPTGQLRYQNTSPSISAGRIKSIVQDVAGNLSAVQSVDLNIDWTSSSAVSGLSDGLGADISTTTNNTQLSANWLPAVDTHSDVSRYFYAIGTSPGATDVLTWTDNYWNDTVTVTGLNLVIGTTYYFSVKAENGAGLISPVVSSNGQQLVAPTAPPTASFISQNSFICQGDLADFENTSNNGTAYFWSFTGGSPATSTTTNPSVAFATTGDYAVQLIVTGPGGADTTVQTIHVEVSLPVTALYSVNADTLYLPSATLTCNNSSLNANGYSWSFGDGGASQDENPWHMYTQVGTYTVSLVAVNNSCPSDTLLQQIVVMDLAGLVENESLTFDLFPNPSTDEVHFSAEGELFQLLIYDCEGKVVYSCTQAASSIIVPVSQWASGNYSAVIVRSGEYSRSKKMIVVNRE